MRKNERSKEWGIRSGVLCFIILYAPLWKYIPACVMFNPDWTNIDTDFLIRLAAVTLISVFFGFSIYLREKVIIIFSTALVIAKISYWIWYLSSNNLI